MRFEWDEAKRQTNLEKHGLDLLRGAALFSESHVYTYPSPRREEARFVTVGLLQSEFVALVWTPRGAATRLISCEGPEMRKKERIARYSAEEIAAKIAAGEDETDWERVRAMPQDEVERLADEEDDPLPEGWDASIVRGLPIRKRDVHIRLDADVLDWFRAQGKDYQAQINEVLRAFVEARKRSEPASRSGK